MEVYSDTTIMPSGYEPIEKACFNQLRAKLHGWEYFWIVRIQGWSDCRVLK